MELYLLRRHFQISALEAEHLMPNWEREMLIRRLAEELGVEEQPTTDPFAEVPKELLALG